MSYDVFISHSSYDKDEVVRPLTLALQARDLRVWLDEQQMNIGDSIRGSIENALQKSRFGVVILSPAYKGSAWGKQELNALFAKEKYQDKVILPIYHGVTIEDVEEHWPLLADKISLNALAGSDELADKIYQSILQSDDGIPIQKNLVEPIELSWLDKHWKWFVTILATGLLATLFVSPLLSTWIGFESEQKTPDFQQKTILESTRETTANSIINIDIEGIKLGMSPDEIKNIISCKYGGPREGKVNGVTSYFIMFCTKEFNHEKPNEVSREYTHYSFDIDKKLVNLHRSIKFGLAADLPPNWESIESKILKKYGTPNISGSYNYKTDNNLNNNVVSYCWGSCYSKVKKNGNEARGKSDGVYLVITRYFMGVREEGTKNYYHALDFSLRNHDDYFEAITSPEKKAKKQKDINF